MYIHSTELENNLTCVTYNNINNNNPNLRLYHCAVNRRQWSKLHFNYRSAA